MLRAIGRESNQFGYHPKIIGIIERIFYMFSWLAIKPEFIGFWLALKVAGQWKRWEKDSETGLSETGLKKKIPGRAVFNVFLIGNGLSILFGIMGALIVQWLSEGQIWVAIVVPSTLILGAYACYQIVKNAPEYEYL